MVGTAGVFRPNEAAAPGGISMNQWEEAEARYLRTQGPGALSLTIWQRLKAAGIDQSVSFLPARGLARIYFWGVDLAHLVDAMMVAPAGDLSLHLAELYDWCRTASIGLEGSARPFLLLLDRLQVDPRGQVPEAPSPGAALPPEAQGKIDGQFRQWHLLYERLDLKAEAEGLPVDIRRPLCRDVAEVYAEFIRVGDRLQSLLRADRSVWSQWVRLFSEVDATFHYHLGPRRLSAGRLDAGSPPSVGLPTRILLALSVPGAWGQPG